METERLLLRIRTDQIAFLKFILEGYDNLAVLTTVDRHSGLVALLFPPERRREVIELVSGIAARLRP